MESKVVPDSAVLTSDSLPSARHQLKLQDHGQVTVYHAVACLIPSFCRYQFILLGDRSTWVRTTCPELLPDNDSARHRTHDLLIYSLMPYRYTTKPPQIWIS